MAEASVNDETPSVVIITGMSGAGRTEAMHVFEDLGYYCVDNLPSNLIREMITLNNLEDTKSATDKQHASKKLALVCDARNGEFFGSLLEVVREMRASGIDFQMLFLDAGDDRLVARYKSSRRRHPMCTDGTTIAQGIQRERMLLMEVREESDHVIDTTDMLPQVLRSNLRSLFAKGNERKGLAVTVYSFGFKHGAPVDADLVMDVRFLPNPYYDPDLRDLTGLDPAVRDFVMLRDETIDFKKKWHALLDVVMPGYVAEGKQQLAIAIGCTGGQHRSVAIAESTGDFLKARGYRVSVAHRDMKLATGATDKEDDLEEGERADFHISKEKAQ